MTRPAARARSCAGCTCVCMREVTSMRPSTTCAAERRFISFRSNSSSATPSSPTCVTRCRAKRSPRTISSGPQASERIRTGDRLLLRTDHNNAYDGGTDKWMKASPYLTIGATEWCISKGVVIVGYDFYHGNDEPGAPRVFHNSRTLSEHGIITMPYLKNLDRITKDRVTLIGFPLNIIGAEASPVRAVVLL